MTELGRTDIAPMVGERTERPTIQELFTAHSSFVWRMLRRLGVPEADAHDATQQVFMIVHRHLDRITADTARGFLHGTAVRVAANVRRGIRRRRETMEETEPGPMGATQNPESHADAARARALLDGLLDAMPDELRRVLVLIEIEQLEAREVAALERIPVGTVASRLRRARELFRKLLAKVDHLNPFAEGS